MRFSMAITSLLIAVLVAGVIGQSQTVSGSSSVSVSASSLQDLQNQIQSEAEEAFSSLDSSGSNLDAAVQQLTQVVAQAVAGVLVNLLESGSVNATAAGVDISNAVGGALSAAASSAGGDLANLDVADITANISTSVESTINSADSSTTSAELTQQVAQEVLNSLGGALAQATGGSFSAQVSVSSVATAAPIALNLVNVDVSGAARTILELMANGSYSEAVSEMSRVLLDGGTNQIKEVLTTSVDQGLNQSFIQVMTDLYQNQSFPILPFSVALGTAYGEVENQGAFVDLLGQVFTDVNLSGEYPNLREALYYAFTSQGGNIRAAYDQSLSSAIEDGGCNSVAQVLAAGKDRADELGLGTLFMIAIQNNPDINECLQVGVELQVSIDILGQLADTQRAVQLILDAISKGQIITISNLIIQAIQDGQFSELQQVLTQVFCDEGIQQDQLVEAVSATVTDGLDQGLLNVTKVLGDILANANCDNQASRFNILNNVILGNDSENQMYAFLVPLPETEYDGSKKVWTPKPDLDIVPESRIWKNQNSGINPANEIEFELQKQQHLSFNPMSEVEFEFQQNSNQEFDPVPIAEPELDLSSEVFPFSGPGSDYGTQENLQRQVFLTSESIYQTQENLNLQGFLLPDQEISKNLNPAPEPYIEVQENFVEPGPENQKDLNLNIASDLDENLNSNRNNVTEFYHEIDEMGDMSFHEVPEFELEFESVLDSEQPPNQELDINPTKMFNSKNIPPEEEITNLDIDNQQSNLATQPKEEFIGSNFNNDLTFNLIPVSENFQNVQIQSGLGEDADFDIEPNIEPDFINKQKQLQLIPQTELVLNTSQLLQGLVISSQQIFQQIQLPNLDVNTLQPLQSVVPEPEPEPESQIDIFQNLLQFNQSNENLIVDDGIFNLGSFVHNIVIYSSKYEFKVKESEGF